MDSSPRQHARAEACRLNQALPHNRLVVMHSGNASVLDVESGRLYIKPSGLDYERITPQNVVEVELASGKVGAGQMRPSVDLPHHLFLYGRDSSIRSIIHTHSNYATAFAACLKAIPLCLTAIADEFGDEIPCTPYVSNEGDAIGRAILAHRNRAPAILLGNHGVFAWGPTPDAALKAAVMVEDVARTVYLAMQVGEPALLARTEVERWHGRYSNHYGQADNAADAEGLQLMPPAAVARRRKPAA